MEKSVLRMALPVIIGLLIGSFVAPVYVADHDYVKIVAMHPQVESLDTTQGENPEGRFAYGHKSNSYYFKFVDIETGEFVVEDIVKSKVSLRKKDVDKASVRIEKYGIFLHRYIIEIPNDAVMIQMERGRY